MDETPIVAVTDENKELFWPSLEACDGIRSLVYADSDLQLSQINTTSGRVVAVGDKIAAYSDQALMSPEWLQKELPDIYDMDGYHLKIGPFLLVADNGLISCYSYA